MKKLLMFLIMGMFLISFTSALSELDPVQQGDCVELFQYCDDCTFVNWTGIEYPNGTFDVSINEPMTKTNLNYNYTFCGANEIGNYKYFVTGDKFGSNKQEEIHFKVTPDGKEYGLTDSILYIGLLIGLIIFFLVSSYGAIKIPYNDNYGDSGKLISINDMKYLKLLSIMATYGILTWIANLMIYLSNIILNSSIFLKFFEIMFKILMVFLYPFMIFMVIFLVVQIVKDFKKGKLIERGII